MSEVRAHYFINGVVGGSMVVEVSERVEGNQGAHHGLYHIKPNRFRYQSSISNSFYGSVVLDAMLMLSKTSSPQKLLQFDCITLYTKIYIFFT